MCPGVDGVPILKAWRPRLYTCRDQLLPSLKATLQYVSISIQPIQRFSRGEVHCSITVYHNERVYVSNCGVVSPYYLTEVDPRIKHTFHIRILLQCVPCYCYLVYRVDMVTSGTPQDRNERFLTRKLTTA